MSMTPFLQKLNALDTDRLRSIQAHIDTLLATRLDTRVAYGREGWFISKNGERIDVTVDAMNRTTVSVHETESGKKWRVSKQMLQIVPIERKVALPVKPLLMPHRPVTVGDGSW